MSAPDARPEAVPEVVPAAAVRGGSRLRLRRAVAIRSVAYLAVWAPFGYALIRTLRQGWRPVADNAMIGLHAWDAMSAQGLLVGQATRLAHGVYDPGPLEFWLLAVPVRLDPAHGLLWGGALWCVVAASLAIEAAASAAGELGAVIAGGMILGFVAWIPQVATLPAWNPWFGGMFFLTALAACWAVMSGRRQWWPVLAVAGSVAAQAHLEYAILSAALVLAGLFTVIVDSLRSKKYRWAITGIIAGLACWTGPLIQQFTSRTGNITALIDNALTGSGAKAGASFGMKALSAATQPPAYWWRSMLPQVKLGMIEERSAWFGVAQLIVMGLILLVAIVVLRSRRAAALAAVSLLTGVAAVETYSGIPVSNLSVTPSTFNNLTYLMAPMFAVGVLAWLAAATAVILLGRQTAPWLRARAAAAQAVSGRARVGRIVTARRGLPVAGLAAVALTVVLASRAVVQVGGTPESRKLAISAVGSASATIEREISARRLVLVVVSPNGHYRRQVTLGLAYALRTAGYIPEALRAYGALQIGSAYHYDEIPATQVKVYVQNDAQTRVLITGGPGIHPP